MGVDDSAGSGAFAAEGVSLWVATESGTALSEALSLPESPAPPHAASVTDKAPANAMTVRAL